MHTLLLLHVAPFRYGKSRDTGPIPGGSIGNTAFVFTDFAPARPIRLCLGPLSGFASGPLSLASRSRRVSPGQAKRIVHTGPCSHVGRPQAPFRNGSFEDERAASSPRPTLCSVTPAPGQLRATPPSASASAKRCAWPCASGRTPAGISGCQCTPPRRLLPSERYRTNRPHGLLPCPPPQLPRVAIFQRITQGRGHQNLSPQSRFGFPTRPKNATIMAER